MNDQSFSKRIKMHVDYEVKQAADLTERGDLECAFHHLERAHILGQSVTIEHTRVHWLMLKIGWRKRDFKEVFGQIIRLIGASTKTPVGIYPSGNTGGANVWFFKPLPIPRDLQKIIKEAGKELRNRANNI